MNAQDRKNPSFNELLQVAGNIADDPNQPYFGLTDQIHFLLLAASANFNQMPEPTSATMVCVAGHLLRSVSHHKDRRDKIIGALLKPEVSEYIQAFFKSESEGGAL